MNRMAGVALTTASLFLLVVAVMLNSPALFYMSTAMIVTLAASRLQAWMAVRGLTIERYAPSIVTAGEPVVVELVVSSLRKLRRPLLQLIDHVPKRMMPADRTPALPIAPAYGLPLRTQYRFRPMRRGVYHWSKITVFGTDALGLIGLSREYAATPASLTVLPRPVPISFELPASSGWGFTETEYGRARGAGIQPRGVREYLPGDALRFVHWPSSARRGQLLVKEFEVGSHAGAALIFQLKKGSDVGAGPSTTLELMCSHAAYLIGWYLRQGVDVALPGRDEAVATALPHEREQALLRAIAELAADSDESLAQQVERVRFLLEPGSVVALFVALAEEDLPHAVTELTHGGHPVTALLYDASAFASKRKKLSQKPATDRDFINELYAAGASVQIAPTEGVSL